jgi:hypothetical protein
MDKRKGYVLLLINAGVRSSVSERKKISAAAPLRVMCRGCDLMLGGYVFL